MTKKIFYTPGINEYLDTELFVNPDLEALYNLSKSRTVGETISEVAARLCYDSLGRAGHAPNFLRSLVKSKHFDVFEHVNYMGDANLSGISFEGPGRYLTAAYTDYPRGILCGNARALRDNMSQITKQMYSSMYRVGIVELFPHDKHNTPYFTEKRFEFNVKPYVKGIVEVWPISANFARGYEGEIVGRCAWYIKGVSRAMTHQLVRHRLLSFSQQSQRYVDSSDCEIVIPKSFEKFGKDTTAGYLESVKRDIEVYNAMREAKVKREDARFVLPSGLATKIIVSGEPEGLEHFFKLRTAKDAQWEIRDVACAMQNQYREILSNVGNT